MATGSTSLLEVLLDASPDMSAVGPRSGSGWVRFLRSNGGEF